MAPSFGRNYRLIENRTIYKSNHLGRKEISRLTNSQNIKAINYTYLK